MHNQRIEGIHYYDTDFLKLLTANKHHIETIKFYYAFRTVIIQAALVNENGKYNEDCMIRITADEITYYWE